MLMCCYVVHDGMVSPLCVIFYCAYCFANKVICAKVFFPFI